MSEFFNGLRTSYKINFGKGDTSCELIDEILTNQYAFFCKTDQFAAKDHDVVSLDFVQPTLLVEFGGLTLKNLIDS